MSKPKLSCYALSCCPCGSTVEVKNFTSDQTLARWPEIAYANFNNRCTKCGNPNHGTLRIGVEATEEMIKNASPSQAISKREDKTLFLFNKDSFFEFYYKLHYDWCEVQGCEAKFYKQGKFGHHLCTTHYEEALKIEAEQAKLDAEDAQESN